MLWYWYCSNSFKATLGLTLSTKKNMSISVSYRQLHFKTYMTYTYTFYMCVCVSVCVCVCVCVQKIISIKIFLQFFVIAHQRNSLDTLWPKQSKLPFFSQLESFVDKTTFHFYSFNKINGFVPTHQFYLNS